MQQTTRRIELDFLRGIAILLVLFRHDDVSIYAKNLGWIGVDLFFVLSGYLVSGLLFTEYKRHGSIKPGRFLIRRGFKIYPLYYLTYLLYLLGMYWTHEHIKKRYVLSDLLFYQNYKNGWGYIQAPSWSIAVEEHFYLGLTALLFLLFNRSDSKNKVLGVPILIFVSLIIMIICLGWRFYNNLYLPYLMEKNTTMTHLRLDALLAGVLIGYLYHFKREGLTRFYIMRRKWLVFVPFALLSFTPFVEVLDSFFALTIGYTLTYLAFGTVLIIFLLETNIATKLKRVFSSILVVGISQIGVWSYSIYLIHSFVIHKILRYINFPSPYLRTMLYLSLSILLGWLLTITIERYFLILRDQNYPSREKQ